MNPKKHLILLKGEDKTDVVKWCEYSNGLYNVTFEKSNRTLNYSYNNVEWIKNPSTINIDNCAIYDKNARLNNVLDVIVFDGYYKVFFANGYRKLYSRDELRILESAEKVGKSKSIMDYFRALSRTITIMTEDGISLMAKKYEKLTFIHPNSCLALYLSGECKIVEDDYDNQVIYPFGCNLSQKQAVQIAIKNHISVIQGPPGTGKTQTILNIIANAIVLNKTVAVVSSNNSATLNVLEKLQAKELDFFAAYLGNADNKEKFIDKQLNKEIGLSEMSPKKEDELRTKIEEKSKTIGMSLKKQNDIALLKQMLNETKTEKHHFENYFNETYLDQPTFILSSHISSKKLLELWVKLENLQDASITMNWFKQFIFMLKYRIRNGELLKGSTEKIIPVVQRAYYDKKIVELEKEIFKQEKKLVSIDFGGELESLKQMSMTMFKGKLANKYAGNIRKKFVIDDLWKDGNNFLEEYPLILSTTFSITSSLSRDILFDYVIVDEASQVDLLTGVLAMSCAKNLVVVGDRMQLPNVVTNEHKTVAQQESKNFDINENYRYEKHSLLTSVLATLNNVPNTLLREHYRCHPKIIQFCNQKFYNNELIILTNDQEDEDVLKVYKTVAGNHARGRVNHRQIDEIIHRVIPDLGENIDGNSIGIISPYRAQGIQVVKELKNDTIEVDTVHKYQGREKDNIIITTVDNEISEFADNPNLLNVAISRAKKKLRLVISDNDNNMTTNIGDLIRYVKHQNFEVVEGGIYSVFDLLYQDYSLERKKYLYKTKRISEYDSENIMYKVLMDLLTQTEFCDLSVACHIPLKMLIKDVEKLEDDEIQYMMNRLTHVDFVIFRKIDKSIVLVIEVDGYKYHQAGTIQSIRDRKKDSILYKYAVEFLRLSTTGSGEEQKIREALRRAKLG